MRRLLFRVLMFAAVIMYRARAAGILGIVMTFGSAVVLMHAAAPHMAAMAATPLAETPRPTQTQTSPSCLPPGLAEGVWTLPVVYASMAEINIAGTQDTAPMALVVYLVGAKHVAIGWVGARMATVDLDVEDKNARPWVNLGVANEAGELRRHPSARCEWAEVQPKGPST